MFSRILSNASVMRQSLFNPTRLRRQINTKAERMKRYINRSFDDDADDDMFDMYISPKQEARMNKIGHDGRRQWERDVDEWEID